MTLPANEGRSDPKILSRPFGRWGGRCHALMLVLLFGSLSTVMGSTQTKAEPECIPIKAMGMERRLKRYVIDSKRQVTIPLTIGTTDKISHRLANAIFIKFIQQVVGYQEIKLTHFNDTMTDYSLDHSLNDDKIPSYLINLEVWIPPGFSDRGGIMADRGAQGTGGRFGWYVSRGKVIDPNIIVDHWRSYLDESIAQYFALSKEEIKKVKSSLTLDADGNHYCLHEMCTDGMFIPEICRTKNCSTLFAGDFAYSSFLMDQVIYEELLVQVAWIGPKLTTHFIENFRAENPILFFSWWPSPITVLQDILRVAFPSCTEVNIEKTNNYLCRYEMHTLRKLAWTNLEDFGKLAYDTVGRFSLYEDDYRTILVEYNRLTADHHSLLFKKRKEEPGWDDAIIDKIACDWLKRTTGSNKTVRKVKLWRPFKFAIKPHLWFAGIFPVQDTAGRYSSRTLVYAANMAIRDVNRNSSILNDFKLELITHNGACARDEVLFAFIRYVRNPSHDLSSLIGILGPSCSHTVEPLAGIAKLFNTIVISYSAEGAIIRDQGKYPYFFRTIPENILYRHVYLHLFKQLKWKRLASFTEDGNKYSEYLTLLEDNLQAENISIFNRKFPREARKDMGTYLKSLKDDHYRIIIGDFYHGMACVIMCEAFKLRMTARDGFVWFLPRWFNSQWYDECNKIHDDCTKEEILQAIDGHLSLGYAYYADDSFVYHSGETVGQWKQRHEHLVNVAPADYAGYTYDAVWTYAFALDKLLKEDFTHASNLRSNSTNQRFVQYLRQTDFQGVSGHIYFPEGTTSRQTLVNIMQFRSNLSTEEGIYRIVGTFHPDDSLKGGGTITLNRSAIEWLTADGLQPEDGSPPEIVCALEAFSKLLGVSCEFTIVITMLICFAVFACFIIICFVVYKIKYEKIEPPPWQLRNLINLDEWEIPRDHVVINRTIGAGAFGTVYGGECLINEESGWAAVAVKTLKKGSTVENRLDFLGEAEMMKRFEHRNIVKLIGLSTRVEPIYMIMEFMLYGDLQTYLLARRHLVSERTLQNDDDEISNRRLTSMALDVACALEYLASNKYVHRDVASRNCLVNADRVVKLSDFGMTRPVYENNYYRFNRKGLLPVRWMAPESIEDGIYTTMTDAWSYGVLLYEIITFGNFPFQGLSNNEVLEHVAKHGNTIKAPAGIRPQLERILYRCWAREPKNRLTFSELIEIFSNYPRLITPCLEIPIASVQTNDSDSLEIATEATRKVTVPKSLIRSSQAQPPPQVEEMTTTSVVRRNSDTIDFPGVSYHPGCNPVLLSDPSSTSRAGRNRTPVENGNGPTLEPLLGGDSYITRYACLQMSHKLPDEVDNETVSPDTTAV